ncbi:helix-turn-helix domain-containing protein [Streptomyces sp. OspMP-M43]|uniref:helix-turn-helix domain-containing protein n=1 Tax=Streptomyces sp. OspMP-M43 TaxID=1839781 RepID=UPI001EFB4327|nr:helix-turn-helix domain-containing protein [Streptomyces sp. OspMP-M43]
MQDLTDFAELLCELKERSGLSYEALAKQAHMSTSTLHRYCSGEGVPTDNAAIARVARVCRATSEELNELHRRWALADAVRNRARQTGDAKPPRPKPHLPQTSTDKDLPQAVGQQHGPAPAPGLMAMPRAVLDFTGRSQELNRLASLAGGPLNGQSPVIVISGQPGVGKTSLAVHAITELSHHFPDGCFFVDLRGLDARPLDPGIVLERLIRALEPAHGGLPLDLGDRAAQYRSVAAGRRIAVILDNAADEAQIRPLLPATGAVMTLVTSRRILTGLEGVVRLPLPSMPDAEARDLLRRLITGLPDTDRTADAVSRLAQSCGNLPLALRIVGNRLASRPDWSPERLAARLKHEERRLDALTAGDLNVTVAFELSYKRLSDTAQRLFRRLSLIPGQHCGPELAAVLTGLPDADTEDALDELVEFGLVQSVFTARYRLHDLIRIFALRRLEQDEPEGERAAVEARTMHWLLDTAIAAGYRFDPDFKVSAGERDDRVRLDSPEAAQQWLTTEADNWLAALETAATTGQWRRVVDVAESMHWFSDRWIHWGYWPRVFTLSSNSAAELADHAAAATHLNYLSWAYNTCLGDTAAASIYARRAQAEAALAGDPRLQAWADSYLAVALLKAGDAHGALPLAARAMRGFRTVNDREGMVMHAFSTLGRALERTGNPVQALRAYQQRLALASNPATAPSPVIADMTRVSAARDIGMLHLAQGRWQAVVDILGTAVAWEPASNIPQWQAQMYTALGQARHELGQTRNALADMDRAMSIYREIGDDDTARTVQVMRRRLAPDPKIQLISKDAAVRTMGPRSADSRSGGPCSSPSSSGNTMPDSEDNDE